MKLARLALLSVLILGGCISTRVAKLDGSEHQRSPKNPDSVAVFLSADRVPYEYEEIALIDSRGDSIWRSEAAMVDQIRKKAAKLGADAVILDAMSEPGTGAKVASFLLFGGDVAGRRGKAVAIVKREAF